MRKVIIIPLSIFIVLISVYIYINKTTLKFENNQNLAVNIKEKIVFSTSVLEKWVVHDVSDKYSYDFNENRLALNKEKFIESHSKRSELHKELSIIKDKYYILDWKLYFQDINVYSCVEEFCQFYLTNSNRYLIFIDKNQYKSWFINKTFWLDIIKVLDLEKFEYKTFDEFSFWWKKLSISSVEWYIN